MASRRAAPPSPATLLAWHSTAHGVAVLRNAVELLRQRGVDLRKVVYLCQKARDRAEAAPVCQELHVELAPVQLSLHGNQVTRHRVILEALEAQVLPLVAGETALHINISPGTPAMHAVWLVLHARGAFPLGTRLWSTQKDRDEKSYLDEVDFAVNTYLQEIRREQEAAPDRGHFDLDPRSARRREAHEQLLRYARLRMAPLLVVGERGSGKTRLLEDRLAQIKGRDRVVTVACGTLSEELALSQLFGHRKGAFTGADQEQPGYLEKAQGQILLLDEVQDLGPRVQRLLVRVLQDPRRRFQRLGDKDGTEHTADVEIACASHLPLARLQRALDEDLFDRLSLLVIEWPPLRECREDLPSDFRQVWRELCQYAQLSLGPPDDPLIWETLTRADLPGNLRDLQRLAYLLMARHGRPRWVQEAVAEWTQMQGRLVVAEQEQRPTRSAEELKSLSWEEHVHQFKRELAQEAHERFGSYKAAAKALQTTDTTLRNSAGKT